MNTQLPRNTDKKKRFKLSPIYGDCLALLGILNRGGGYAIIDTMAKIKVGDVVHCRKEPDSLNSYIKQVKEIKDDGTYIVGTSYIDSTKDYTFEAAQIHGVVIETYAGGNGITRYREYVRPTHLRKKTKEVLK